MYIYPLNKRGCASVLFSTVYWRVWLTELAGVMDHLANRTMDDGKGVGAIQYENERRF